MNALRRLRRAGPAPHAWTDLPSARADRGRARPSRCWSATSSERPGEERWLLHKATPVFDPDGSLSMVINVIEDVTEVKRAELAQRLLADAGEALASSLDYEQTLQRVAQLAVPGLADWCGVSMRGEGDLLEQVAVAHVDPDKVELARDFGRRYPTRLNGPGGAAEVMRTGRAPPGPARSPTEMLDAADGHRGAASSSSASCRCARSSSCRSPWPGAGRRSAPSRWSWRSPAGPSTMTTSSWPRSSGRRAGTAVENARLYTERSRIADALQQSLLPPELPDLPGFRLASLYRAAGDQNEVGGDFYDAFEVPGGWMVVVGRRRGTRCRGGGADLALALHAAHGREASRRSDRRARGAQRGAARAAAALAGHGVLRAAARARRGRRGRDRAGRASARLPHT